jgi:hypothetical protein
MSRAIQQKRRSRRHGARAWGAISRLLRDRGRACPGCMAGPASGRGKRCGSGELADGEPISFPKVAARRPVRRRPAETQDARRIRPFARSPAGGMKKAGGSGPAELARGSISFPKVPARLPVRRRHAETLDAYRIRPFATGPASGMKKVGGSGPGSSRGESISFPKVAARVPVRRRPRRHRTRGGFAIRKRPGHRKESGADPPPTRLRARSQSPFRRYPRACRSAGGPRRPKRAEDLPFARGPGHWKRKAVRIRPRRGAPRKPSV